MADPKGISPPTPHAKTGTASPAPEDSNKENDAEEQTIQPLLSLLSIARSTIAKFTAPQQSGVLVGPFPPVYGSVNFAANSSTLSPSQKAHLLEKDRDALRAVIPHERKYSKDGKVHLEVDGHVSDLDTPAAHPNLAQMRADQAAAVLREAIKLEGLSNVDVAVKGQSDPRTVSVAVKGDTQTVALVKSQSSAIWRVTPSTS